MRSGSTARERWIVHETVVSSQSRRQTALVLEIGEHPTSMPGTELLASSTASLFFDEAPLCHP